MNKKSASQYASYFLDGKLHVIEENGFEVYTRTESLLNKPKVRALYEALEGGDLHNANDIANNLTKSDIDHEIKRKINVMDFIVHESKNLMNVVVDSQNHDILKMLIEKGGDLNAPTKIKIDLGTYNQTKFKKFQEFEISPLYRAVLNEDVKIAKELLEAKADVNNGLHVKIYQKIRVEEQDKNIQSQLVSPAKDPEFVIQYSKDEKINPLQEAVEQNRVKISKLLIKYGAKIEHLPKSTQKQYTKMMKEHEKNQMKVSVKTTPSMERLLEPKRSKNNLEKS
jgi:ankyrin repeat protein